MRHNNKITLKYKLFFILSSEKYGDLTIDIEHGKKEDRSHDMNAVPFRKFLDSYKENDVYMVQNIQDPMKGVTSLVHQVALFSHYCIGG